MRWPIHTWWRFDWQNIWHHTCNQHINQLCLIARRTWSSLGREGNWRYMLWFINFLFLKLSLSIKILKPMFKLMYLTLKLLRGWANTFECIDASHYASWRVIHQQYPLQDNCTVRSHVPNTSSWTWGNDNQTREDCERRSEACHGFVQADFAASFQELSLQLPYGH